MLCVAEPDHFRLRIHIRLACRRALRPLHPGDPTPRPPSPFCARVSIPDVAACTGRRSCAARRLSVPQERSVSSRGDVPAFVCSCSWSRPCPCLLVPLCLCLCALVFVCARPCALRCSSSRASSSTRTSSSTRASSASAPPRTATAPHPSPLLPFSFASSSS